ncbi:hypothetical protein GRF21_30515 [Pseudomonas aeruginosa]|uniref:hypothetical protein n=1 Tax=Pseudomonas aeruginosa TaxID=287 RepID=UPI001CA57ED5|nr:hypothetical protein [Pseudomonas aeruginosa]MBW5455395.1 hypothetical protein [Pseudomonas aeruginosa]
MNYSSLSASDLLKHRSHHVDSLTRLRRARPQWDEDAARRAEITMTDISDQIREIDTIMRRRDCEYVVLVYSCETAT